MNHSEILDKIANIYNLRNVNSGYNKLFLFTLLLGVLGYIHYMFRRIVNDNNTIINQNIDLRALIIKKCIADNKYMSKPLLWV